MGLFTCTVLEKDLCSLLWNFNFLKSYSESPITPITYKTEPTLPAEMMSLFSKPLARLP